MFRIINAMQSYILQHVLCDPGSVKYLSVCMDIKVRDFRYFMVHFS